MRPAILYGSEVITYNDVWVQRLEATQYNVARWLTGTSQCAAKAGLRE